MPTFTTHFGFYKPAEGDGQDNAQQWAEGMNGNLDAIDALLKTHGDTLASQAADIAANATAIAGKMTNPMTTAGDMIVGGVVGAPTRVPKGNENEMWAIRGETPAWVSQSDFLVTAAFMSPVDLIGSVTERTGNYTIGVAFFTAATNLKCAGVRYYAFSGRTYRVSLWNAAGTRVTYKDELAGATGPKTTMFAAAQALAQSQLYKVSIREVTGTYYQNSTVVFPPLPLQLNPVVVVSDLALFVAAADAAPTSTTSNTARYAIEPVLSL